MTTPDNPSPQDPRAQQPEEPRPGGHQDQQAQAGQPAAQADPPPLDETQVNPKDALRNLGQQPRIDEQGHATAYTAVPPPLGQQQPQQPGQQQGQPQPQPQPQGQWQPPADYGQQSHEQPYVQQPGGYDQPPVYGQPPTPQQVPQDSPYAQQPYGQQPPAYAQPQFGQQQQPQQQQPGYGGYPPPPPPGYSNAPYPGAPYATGQPPGMPPFATWGQRAGAWLIDNLVATLGISLTEAAYYDWGNGARTTGWVIALIGIVWSVYNAYLAGQTGQSTGKRMAGIRLARYVDGQVVGPAYALLRLFMNVVFWAICFIPGLLNYLWPLWDQKSQTWSDKIASSVVVQAR